MVEFIFDTEEYLDPHHFEMDLQPEDDYLFLMDDTVVITPPKGEVELTSNTNISQTVELINDDQYVIRAAVHTVVSADVKPGMVESVDPLTVDEEGLLYLRRTRLKQSFVPNQVLAAGISDYRITATSGYNGDDLTKDIPVYQGEFL